MISNTKSLFIIKDLNIDKIKEDIGYNFYFPEIIYFDLINLISYHRYSCFSDAIIQDNEVTKFYKSFSTSFFNLYNNETLSYAAMYMLKDLAQTTSLKALENNEVETTEAKNNYLLSLSDRELTFLEEEINNQQDLTEIIKHCLKFEMSFINTENRVQRKCLIRNYGEITKIRKIEFVKPLFYSKLVSKNLFVNKINDIKEPKYSLVFIEDKSESMQQSNVFNILKALQLMMLRSNLTIHYYYFAGFKLIYKKLETIEEKLEHFKNNQYYLNNCNYNHLFSELSKKHKNENILLFTDGKDSINLKSLNFIFNCINVNRRDFILKDLCKINNGKYISIN